MEDLMEEENINTNESLNNNELQESQSKDKEDTSNKVKETAIIEYKEIEEPCVALTIIGENKLVVKTFVGNSPDSDTITTTTLYLPPGDFSNVHLRTKFSIKNGVFLVELQGFQIANPSSSSHGASS